MVEQTSSKPGSVPGRRLLTKEFSSIDEPGVYMTLSGEMFRVPGEVLTGGRLSPLEWEIPEGGRVIRISDDPYLPISQCRLVAADADLTVNF